MKRQGFKSVKIVLTSFLVLVCAACGSAGEQLQPSGLSSVTPSAQESSGVTFEPLQPADGSDSPASQEPSSSPSETPSASPAPSKKPEPSATDDHGHDSHKPGKDDDDGASATPSASPEPSESPAPSPTPAKPSPSPSPSKEPATESKTFTVEIKDFAFSPSEIRIKPGDKVKFVNRDSVEHTATGEGGTFGTGLIGQDKSKAVTFEKEGTFTYYCDPHPDMTGKIVVESK